MNTGILGLARGEPGVLAGEQRAHRPIGRLTDRYRGADSHG